MGQSLTKKQKDHLSLKMKKISDAKKCPLCGRKNALNYYVDALVCRWCKNEEAVF